MNLRPRKQQLLGLLPDALVLIRGARHGNTRYLTFDDGPDPEHTPRLLDLLSRHGVKASFFVVGQKVEQYPAVVERIVAEGHMLGNHSYSHWSFKLMSLRKKLREIDSTDALLQAFDGRPHHPMRPPHGYISADLLWHFAMRRRSFIYWSYDSLDYQEQADATLVARLRDHPPQGGDIVLMHDDSGKAGAALGVLLPEWLARDHRFHALPAEA
jgi:peptidoglycan/xylan/chitin deacetylase (PgdA/CDA1 family)